MISDELEEVEFDGHQSIMLRSDVDQIQNMDHIHSIRIVPSWDCYVMFYHPRELFVPQAYRNRIFRQLEGNAPVLLVDGLAAGVWEKQQKKSWTQVLIKPFKPLTPGQKRTVEEEAGLLGEFLGTEIQVSFST